MDDVTDDPLTDATPHKKLRSPRIRSRIRVHEVALPPAVEPLGVVCSSVGVEMSGLGLPPNIGTSGNQNGRRSRFDGRSHETDDWLLGYMATGTGTLRLDETSEYPLQQGSVVSLPPNSRYRVAVDRNRSFCVYSVTFGGQAMRERTVCTAIDELFPTAQTELCDDVIRMYQNLLAVADSRTGDAQRELGASVVLLVAKLVNRVHELRHATGTTSPVERAKTIMGAHLFDQITVDDIAHETGVPTSTFRRLFREQVGVSPYQYFLRQKIEAAQDDLQKAGLPLRAIAEKFGFADQYHFSRVFARIVGCRPTQWRKANQRL